MKTSTGLLVTAFFLLPPAAVAEPPADLDSVVARAMETFEVPGIGLAIVHDGEVVVAKGYGLRALDRSVAVDERTLFGIASNTKAFTATALALLVEEGRVEWDAPVILYVPWFQMWDPYVTRELTVRDLLVHRSGLGLGAGDLLWWPPSTYDRKEIARRLRFVEPATSFRSAYAYDNVLYLIAGEVIEAAGGSNWEDFVERGILKRVGMNDSNVRNSESTRGENSAMPHARVEGRVQRIKPFASDNTNPAGGINSSASDMAKWMKVLLDEGKLDAGARLYSDETARELTTLVTPIPIVEPETEIASQRMSFRGYGLGFNVHDYRGKKVVNHTGGLPGLFSKLTLLPELELGVMVLTNQESGDAYNAITYHVLDHYLGGETTDWVAAYRRAQLRRDEKTAEEEKKTSVSRDAASRPSLPLDGYAGTYRDPWYGVVEIEREGAGLALRFARSPSLVGDLEHWQHDTFVVKWRDRELRADAFISFALNPDGSVEQARMRGGFARDRLQLRFPRLAVDSMTVRVKLAFPG